MFMPSQVKAQNTAEYALIIAQIVARLTSPEFVTEVLQKNPVQAYSMVSSLIRYYHLLLPS